MSKVKVKFLTLMAVIMILPLTAVAMADTVGEAHAAGVEVYDLSDDHARNGTEYSRTIDAGLPLRDAGVWNITGVDWLSVSNIGTSYITVSGTPTNEKLGSYEVTVTGPIYNGNKTAEYNWTIIVGAEEVITLPNDQTQIGIGYSRTIDAAAPLKDAGYWKSTGVDWLSVSNVGTSYITVSGTPTKVGSYDVMIEGPTHNGNKTTEYNWTINVYDGYVVQYNTAGGSNIPQSPVGSGESLILPQASRDGYLFTGWYTAASGGTLIGQAGDSYTPSGNITIYAQWVVPTITIESSPSTLDTYTGQHWSYTVSALPSDATITVSGASWLSVSGKVIISGTVGTPGDYTVTVTASKAGYTSATQTFVIHVVPQLTFESLPSAGFIVTG
jgi:uncharacterized repeat protein (TIGR02543 family)